ncbi:hypothetical protein RMR21_009615 [Agrobacterium sp. rho-8.1]|nr:hypothetical protein [Agrobacterium sp. rho-8.1]
MSIGKHAARVQLQDMSEIIQLLMEETPEQELYSLFDPRTEEIEQLVRRLTIRRPGEKKGL